MKHKLHCTAVSEQMHVTDKNDKPSRIEFYNIVISIDSNIHLGIGLMFNLRVFLDLFLDCAKDRVQEPV